MVTSYLFEAVGNSTANHRHGRSPLVVPNKAVKVLHNSSQLCLSSVCIVKVRHHHVPVLFQLWEALAHGRRYVTSWLSVWEAGFWYGEVQMVIQTTTQPFK